MTITISTSGIALDGPLVAGEKVAVTVSGLALAAEDKPTLALLARFPDALLASVELAEDADAPGTWTGELDTATKQTALFFATARADERRDAALELVAGRVSLARLTVPMANSALCPKPDGSPFASPVYVPVPGPPGTGGDPYDQPPEMDGEASPGSADEYARGDHRHPTDETRQAVIVDLAAIRSGAAAGATAVQPAALSAYRTATAQDAIDAGKLDATGLTNNNGQLGAIDFVTRYSFGFEGGKYISAPENSGAALTDADLSYSSALATALAEKADASSLATVATTGDYGDLLNKPTIPAAQIQSDWNQTNSAAVDFIKNKPTIPAAQVNSDWNAASGVAQILNKPTIPDVSGKADSASIAPAFSASSTYAVGDYVTHEGLLYKCTTAVSTAGAWNAANWTQASAMAEMPAPVDTSNFVQWANNNKNAVTIGTRASGSTIGAGSLSVGDSNTATAKQSASIGYNNQSDGKHALAVGQGNRTVNDNAFAVGESCYAWAKDSFAGGYLARTNPNNYGGGHWGAFVWNGGGGNSWYSSHGDGTFNVKTQGGTSGFYIGETTLATLLSDKADSTSIRYAFASPTPSVSGTTATVACEDRAINDFTVATGVTSLTITPPAAVTGRARDFFCRVTLTDASLPTVTLSGGTIDIGSTEVAGMTQGVNLLMFTEIASGHWLASRRSAS